MNELSATRARVAPFAVVRADANASCSDVGGRWTELTGLDRKASLGGGWVSALHPEDRERVVAAWKEAARLGEPLQCECRLLRAAATTWVIVLALPDRSTDGDVPALTGSLADITAEKRTANRLGLQNAAHDVLGTSPKLEIAARALVDLTQRALDCPLAELWWIDDETAVLCNLALAATPPIDTSDFVDASRSTTFAKGRGLPGAAWDSEAEAWVDAKAAASGGLHAGFVARHGLAGALAVPVALEGRVLGVVVVALADAAQRDRETVACLASVFTQLGQMIERKRIEEAHRRAEELFRYVALATRDAIYDWHIVENVVWRSESYQALYSPEDPVGVDSDWWQEHLHPEEGERVIAGLKGALAAHADVWVDEYRLKRGDGTYAEVLDRGYLLYKDGKPVRMIGAMTDISALRASLRDKEVLLRELHHRVKNNLQIISSLLSLQSQRVGDREARELFRESQKRVRAMALVHENLYGTGHVPARRLDGGPPSAFQANAQFSTVDVEQFLRALTSNVLRLHGAEANRIVLDLDVEEEVDLGVEAAVPCALIVNELLTNSLKHAFKDRAKGSIVVRLRHADGDGIALVVADDGVGNARTTSTLGELRTRSASTSCARSSASSTGVSSSRARTGRASRSSSNACDRERAKPCARRRRRPSPDVQRRGGMPSLGVTKSRSGPLGTGASSTSRTFCARASGEKGLLRNGITPVRTPRRRTASSA